MSEEKKLAQDFLAKLEEIKAKKGDEISLIDIRFLVENLTQKSDKSLYDKILAIAVKIHHLKDEFQDIDGDKLAGDYLPGANVKLDEVVAATEKATHDILDAASKIQEILSQSGNEAPQEVLDQITKIFEACNFQDLTGQHINNVISTLVDVEKIVKAIIKILPEDFKKAIKEEAQKADKAMLQGPQLSSDAPTQDEIDQLFAES